MTYSFFLAGSLPSILPTTFWEFTVRIVLRSVTDAVTPSGTGLKARVTAAFFAFSKSTPASANSFFACSSVIQPSTAARLRFLSGATRPNSSPVLPCTTVNG